MKFVAVRSRRRWYALPNRPAHGLVTPLNSHAGCGFARTLRCLLHLRGLRTLFSSLLCISGTDVIEGHLFPCPVARFTVAERIRDAKCRQYRKISSFRAVADQPAQSFVNQTGE